MPWEGDGKDAKGEGRERWRGRKMRKMVKEEGWKDDKGGRLERRSGMDTKGGRLEKK